MLIKSSILYNGNRIIFNLKLSTYQNIITFITDNNILFLSEMKLDIPTNLHGNCNSNNLLEFLANNSNDNILILNFLKYFMNLIDLRDNNDLKIYYIVNDNIKWQDMILSFYSNKITTTTTTTLAPTTTTTTLAPTTTTTTTLAPRIIQYGRLYNYYAATDSRGIAPAGWHVPSDTELTILTNFLGGLYVAGGKLKETSTSHWSSPNAVATNSTGFSALPGGSRSDSNTFNYLSFLGYWWSATESDTNYAWDRYMYYSNGNVVRSDYNKMFGCAVRCVSDAGNTETTVTDIDGNNYTSVTIGTQTWLVQNLATTHYRNGNIILQDFNGTVGAYANYNNDESYVFY